MADYKAIYFAIDKQHNDYITVSDLEKYVQENGMNTAVVQRWMRLFDPKGTGKITLEDFCDTLGENIHELRRQYPTSNVQQIELLDRDMSDKMTTDVLNLTREVVQQTSTDLKEQAGKLKTFMDKKYGDTWHCFIVNGSHGYFYSHKPNHSLSFLFGGNYYFIYCTPLN